MNLTTAIISIAVGGTVLMGSTLKVFTMIYKWMSRVEKALTYVENEMRHNGGNSLRDHIVRQSGQLEAVQREVTQMRGNP